MRNALCRFDFLFGAQRHGTAWTGAHLPQRVDDERRHWRLLTLQIQTRVKVRKARVPAAVEEEKVFMRSDNTENEPLINERTLYVKQNLAAPVKSGEL